MNTLISLLSTPIIIIASIFQRESTLDALQSTIQEGENLLQELNGQGINQEMDTTGTVAIGWNGPKKGGILSVCQNCCRFLCYFYYWVSQKSIDIFLNLQWR